MADRGRWYWRAVGYASVVALWVSSTIYALTTTGALGQQPPENAGDRSAYLEAYLAYRREGFAFEQVENWLLAAALSGLAVLGGLWPAASAGRDGRALRARAGGILVVTGGVVAGVTQVAGVGALDRVLFASSIGIVDDGALATMVDAIGRTDDYVESFALVLISLGVLAMAVDGPATTRIRGWRIRCLALSIGLLGVVITTLAVSPISDLVLLVAGIILAPLWILALASAVDHAASAEPG